GSIDDIGVTTSIDFDLQSALESALDGPITAEDSAITIDVSEGEVSVDLARLVQDTQGGDYDGTLNNLPVDTEVLGPDIVQAALDGLDETLLDELPKILTTAITDAVNSTDLNIELYGEINGPFGVNIGTLDVKLLGTIGDFIGAEGADEPEVDTSGTSIVGLPVGQLLEPVLQMITNQILPGLVAPISDAIMD